MDSIGNKKTIFSNEKAIRLFLLLIAVFLNLKYIFVDFGIDAEFQISMSYRLATGDIMFKEMWEPYQMSAFFCALVIKAYLAVFHTTTGIVLYLQAIGVVVDGLVAYLLYRVVKKNLDNPNTAFAMAWVFFLVSPKDVPLPEYANMQIWFSMLLCITLFLHYKTRKNRWLILSTLCLCGAVLSYPSCLILLVGVIFLLLHGGKKKDVFIFVSTCIVAGILYLCMIFRQISWSEFVCTVENMLTLETSHAVGLGEKCIGYLKDFMEIVVVFCIAYGLAYLGAKVLSGKKSRDKESGRVLTDALFYGLILFIGIITVVFWRNHIRYCYSLVFLAIIFIGTHYVKKLSADKLYFYLCGTILSFLELAATLLLTNLELIGSIPYLLIATIVAFLPISEAMREVDGKKVAKTLKGAVLICGVIFLAFRNGYIIRPMYLQVNSILHLGGIVKEGPAMGIVSEYMGPYMQNESMKEWEQYIEEGDCIYLIGEPLDTLGYLYADTEIAAPSLVPTPGYNESVLEYWKMNPDKYPDVIIASCWYGTMNTSLTEDSWIMKWMEEEYKPQYYVDGKYWRYYFKQGEGE